MYGCLPLGVTGREITGKFIELFIFLWREPACSLWREKVKGASECRVRGVLCVRRGVEGEWGFRGVCMCVCM